MRLQDLNDEEFADEMSASLGNDLRWHPFVDGQVIEHTKSALAKLTASLDAQLLRYGAGPEADLEWVARTKGLRGIVNARTKEVDRRVARMENSHTEEKRAWKAFAHELCEIIEDAGLAVELDDLDAPFGGITAREWVSRRRVKRGLAA